MTRTVITETDALVETMTNLVSQGVANLTEFATLTPALYADAPWKDETDLDGKPVKVADYFRNTFGIGPSRDGYVSLPQVALDAGSQAFADAGIKPSLSEHVAMTGAARATVARSRARTGLSDDQPQKSPKSVPAQADSPESGEVSNETETQSFDLGALLSALDDNELAIVVASVGTDRTKTLITNLSKLVTV